MGNTGDTDREARRVRDRYARRAERGADDRYSLVDPANLYIFQRRERAIVEMLRRHALLPPPGPVLDVGCGNGAVLRDFMRYGSSPADLVGIDLLPERIAAARAANPAITVLPADASRLPFAPGAFALAVQFTLMSSVLDRGVRRAIASETMRVLRPGGAVLWYDFIWNPLNRDTRGLRLAEIRRLYPGCDIDARRVTLAPPLARRVAGRSPWAAGLLERAPVLRTHYLAVIRKPVA